MKYYIATQHQEVARKVRDAIVAAGHECNASWIDKAEYKSIPETDADRALAASVCHREVAEADELILVSEPHGELVRGGKHVETGIAIAFGKHVHVIGNRENIFHWHSLVRHCETLDDFIAELEAA